MRGKPADGRLFLNMKLRIAAAALLLPVLGGAVFAADNSGGAKPCASCAQKIAAQVSLLEDAGVKVPEPTAPEAPAQPGWTEIGRGAWLHGKPGTGGTLFIGYAGYGADGEGARNWAGAVAAAKGWKTVIAVAGPDKVHYEDAEKLGTNTRILTELIPQLAPDRIIVAAHSSGSFVGREFMALIGKFGKKDLLHKISYYDLDGGPCGPCRKYADDPANSGFVFTCVSAVQPGGPAAPNRDSMKACG